MNDQETGPSADLTVAGVPIYRELIDRAGQEQMVADLRSVVAQAPLFSPETRFGKKMSVGMTSAGKYGWYSDRSKGYRYEPRHPSGVDWPPIPDSVMAIWRKVAPNAREPDACLVNFYREGARLGLHQDRDEADFTQPVVSISLGDEGLFRIGGTERGGKTQSVWLSSGDVLVLGGDARLVYHGIDRVKPGTSTLLSDGGRINLTLRVVD